MVASPDANAEADSLEYQSVLTLKGVGPAVAEKLKKLDIERVQDLLFHLPLRYEDRTTVVPIGSLRAGQRVLVEGVVSHSEVKYMGRRGGRGGRLPNRHLLCHFSDGSGALILRFFHFSAAQQQTLAAGSALRCFGEVRVAGNHLEMAHPEFQRIAAPDPLSPSAAEESTATGDVPLTPVYPATEGVHQRLLLRLSQQVLDKLEPARLDEWIPESITQRLGLPALGEALLQVHRPVCRGGVAGWPDRRTPAQQRLVFEELVAHQLSLLTLRRRARQHTAAALPLTATVLQSFCRQLDFALTGAQQRVIGEILQDIAATVPMMRLLQGDVGSGKTVVAAAAALAAANNGAQVAIMAPTEILAEQHFRNFTDWFRYHRQTCLLLTGKDKGSRRQQKLAMIEEGAVRIVVGTHALFQADVTFHDLALLVVDEQHRFGVHQRLSLREKSRRGHAPHQLIMTATPIPRSLAMTAYADLDYSVIDELPPGRQPVKTVVIANTRRQEVIERVAQACRNGEQAYWVCTLVEASEVLQCQAAETTAEELTVSLPSLRIGLVHGRMNAAEKQRVVEAFRQKEIDMLVATTVIEVGVDVPDASLMVIENAERLGLAQLHQLRGRVGRGQRPSACVLMYQSPLSTQGKQRLAILRETADGFEVAKKDMEMRGPGEVLGTRQTGLAQMRIADLLRDEHWLPEVRKTAAWLVKNRPRAVAPLIRRWLGKAHRFGQV